MGSSYSKRGYSCCYLDDAAEWADALENAVAVEYVFGAAVAAVDTASDVAKLEAERAATCYFLSQRQGMCTTESADVLASRPCS